nr:MAG TPA: hypothetical protein [Caudoviricetes sp.]
MFFISVFVFEFDLIILDAYVSHGHSVPHIIHL